MNVAALKGPTIDVSELSTVAFGKRTPIWWAVILLIVIETTTLATMFVAYLYVQANFVEWPPSAKLPLVPGLSGAATLVVSCIPMWLAKRAATKLDLARTRRWLVIATVLSVAAAPLRAWEIAALPFTWDENAYASIVWTTMGMHCIEGAAGILENVLLSVLLFVGPVEKKHFEDLEVNAVFWFFVALAWLPFAALFYIDGAIR
jgi:cytochrome c oxidase subunit III